MKGWMLLDWICMTPHATEASSNTCTQKGEATTARRAAAAARAGGLWRR